MASDGGIRDVVAVLAMLVCSAPAAGQNALGANLLYESPSLVVPAVMLISSDAEGRRWTVGVTGWTVAAEVSRPRSPERTVRAAAWVTPLNANGSDRFFRDGARVPELGYGNAAAGAALGIALQPSPTWNTEIRLLGRYERVTELPAATVERWRHPFMGLEITQLYQRITAEDPLRSDLEGLRVRGRLQAFAGSFTWGRLTASVDGGHRLGPTLLRGQATYMFGHALDTVSAFLVGGSWDAAGVNTLYGHPYAAFRITQGLVMRGAVDIPLTGEWRFGVRAAHLASPSGADSGGMVRIGTSLSGVNAYIGAAAPAVAIRKGSYDRMLVIGGLSAAILP